MYPTIVPTDEAPPTIHHDAEHMTRPRLSTTAPAPAAGDRRLPLLDILRGAAILGTLMTNVWIFTGPGAEWGILEGGLGDTSFATPSQAAETTFRLLADGKLLSLLTVLFGAGLAIQHASARRRGQPWPGRYPRRALFLLAEGTAHFLLIFAWDVLMGYAITALIVAKLLTRTNHTRHRVMLWAAGIHITLMTLLTAAQLLATDGHRTVSPEAIDLYADGNYLEQITFRLQHALILRAEPILTFFLLLTLFLLGTRLHRAGAFALDENGHRIRTRLLTWGLGLGIPLTAAATIGGPDFFLIGRYVAAPLMALGYLALIGLAVERLTPDARPLTALRAVGRMALSGYVLQNLLCMLACYGIGLGLATRLDAWQPWWTMALWATVSAILIVFANLWLHRFGQGPLEALQHRVLTRGRPQPHTQPAASTSPGTESAGP